MGSKSEKPMDDIVDHKDSKSTKKKSQTAEEQKQAGSEGATNNASGVASAAGAEPHKDGEHTTAAEGAVMSI